MSKWLIIAMILFATLAYGQETRDEQQQAAQELEAAIDKANQSNAWAEYLKTGKTDIPYAVRRKISKEFTRGKGFRIIKGEKVQTMTSPRQQRAIKFQKRKQ